MGSNYEGASWGSISVDEADGTMHYDRIAFGGSDAALDFSATAAHRIAAIDASRHRANRETAQAAAQARRRMRTQVRREVVNVL